MGLPPGGRMIQAVYSVKQIGEEKGEHPLPENETVAPKEVIKLGAGSSRDQVREGLF